MMTDKFFESKSEDDLLTLILTLVRPPQCIQFTNDRQETLLHKAANQGWRRAVNLLLICGAKVTNEDFCGRTPLLQAIESGDEDTINKMLRSGVSIDTTVDSYERTMLHIAVQHDREHIVPLLVDKNANLFVRDAQGRTPIAYARVHRDYEIIDNAILDAIRKGKGPKAVITCAAHGHRRWLLEELIRAGVHVDTRGHRGTTALCEAIENSHADPELVGFLLDIGADVNAKDYGGWTALHAAMEATEPDIVKLLLDKGVDVNAQNNQGMTAMHMRGNLYECSLKRQEITAMLLQAGADLRIRDDDGNTALHVACEDWDADLGFLLKDFKGDINIANQAGQTLLHVATNNMNDEYVRVLLKKGANANIRDADQKTPLGIVREAYAQKDNEDDRERCSTIKTMLKQSMRVGNIRRRYQRRDLPV